MLNVASIDEDHNRQATTLELSLHRTSTSSHCRPLIAIAHSCENLADIEATGSRRGAVERSKQAQATVAFNDRSGHE
jgi:hypothetical protein